MAQLIEQKVDIGKDAYGRQVSATRRRNYDGKVFWTIESAPTGQRDEGEGMTGLTDSNIRELAQALDMIDGKVSVF